MYESFPILTRSRLRAARIPPRFQGLSLDSPNVREVVERLSIPLDAWIERVLAGDVISAAGLLDTCGLGLWLHGGSEAQRGAFLSAVLQDLIIKTEHDGLYLSADDLLEASRESFSGGDSESSLPRAARSRDILVLGSFDFRSTEWAISSMESLISHRYDEGLPTLVSAIHLPVNYIREGLARSAFLEVAIMGSVMGT